MKALIALLLLMITLSLFARDIFLQPGNYECVEGNRPNFCPHFVRPIPFTPTELDGILITYLGDCDGGQGPLFYGCDGVHCEMGEITVDIRSPTEYLWQNLSYDFYCVFKKVNQVP